MKTSSARSEMTKKNSHSPSRQSSSYHLETRLLAHSVVWLAKDTFYLVSLSSILTHSISQKSQAIDAKYQDSVTQPHQSNLLRKSLTHFRQVIKRRSNSTQMRRTMTALLSISLLERETGQPFLKKVRRR